jgi:hypothetical protein
MQLLLHNFICALQIRPLQPFKVHAMVVCTTHKAAVAVVEWHVRRVEDAGVVPDAATPIRKQETLGLAQRAAMEGTLSNVAHHMPMGRTRGRFAAAPRRSELGLVALVDETNCPLTESFVGAGALKMELEVGTVAGSKCRTLQGLLLAAGMYEVVLEVLVVREGRGGAVLPVGDYAISHSLVISVVEGDG